MSRYSNQSSPKDLNRHKFSCPVTIYNSREASFEQPARKSSVSSLHNHIDIDQLMIDIKLKPVKANTSQTEQKVKQIYSCLAYLKQKFNVADQVRTAQLVLQTIQKKIYSQPGKQNNKKRQIQSKVNDIRGGAIQNIVNLNSANKSLSKPPLSSKKDTLALNLANKDISPIKQLQQMTSRIVYTNFSLKQLQSSQKTLNDFELSPNVSLMTSVKKQKNSQGKEMSKIKDVANFSISKFDPEEEQIQKLNRQINALEKMLQKKTSLEPTNEMHKQFKKGKINKIPQSGRKIISNKQNIY